MRAYRPIAIKRCGAFLLTLCIAFICGGPAAAQDIKTELEARVKAAFILNLSRFVTWPEASFPDSDTFNICFYRENPYGEVIDELINRKVGSRSVQIHLIEEFPRPGECQTLFVPTRYINSPPEGASWTSNDLLTISDLTDTEYARRYLGVTLITLLRDKTRVGIAIRRRAAESAGLKLSSELLKLGTILDDEG